MLTSILDLEQSGKYVDFKMMYVFHWSVIVSSPFGEIKML